MTNEEISTVLATVLDRIAEQDAEIDALRRQLLAFIDITETMLANKAEKKHAAR